MTAHHGKIGEGGAVISRGAPKFPWAPQLTAPEQAHADDADRLEADLFEFRFGDFSLLVDGPIGLAALVVVVCALVAGVWAYAHGFLHFAQ